MFQQFLRNQWTDLHKIWNLSCQYTYQPPYGFSWWSMHRCARKGQKRASLLKLWMIPVCIKVGQATHLLFLYATCNMNVMICKYIENTSNKLLPMYFNFVNVKTITDLVYLHATCTKNGIIYILMIAMRLITVCTIQTQIIPICIQCILTANFHKKLDGRI